MAEQTTQSAAAPLRGAERQTAMQDLILLYMRAAIPALRNHPLKVQYRPRCPYLFCARRGQDKTVITLSARPDKPDFLHTIRRAALAALEIAEGRTSAVQVRTDASN